MITWALFLARIKGANAYSSYCFNFSHEWWHKNFTFHSMLPQSTQIISAPSILGLKPTGVDKLSEKLMSLGLAEKLNVTRPVIYQKHFNVLYSTKRDDETMIINGAISGNF